MSKYPEGSWNWMPETKKKRFGLEKQIWKTQAHRSHWRLPENKDPPGETDSLVTAGGQGPGLDLQRRWGWLAEGAAGETSLSDAEMAGQGSFSAGSPEGQSLT